MSPVPSIGSSIRSNPICDTRGASRANSAVVSGEVHTHVFTPICITGPFSGLEHALHELEALLRLLDSASRAPIVLFDETGDGVAVRFHELQAFDDGCVTGTPVDARPS